MMILTSETADHLLQPEFFTHQRFSPADRLQTPPKHADFW